MASVTALLGLPECLFNLWPVGGDEFRAAKARGDFDEWSVTRLATTLLGCRVRMAQDHGALSPQLSKEYPGTLAETCSTSAPKALVTDLSLPYPWLRRLQGTTGTFYRPDRLWIDTDNAIIYNEIYIRFRGAANIDHRYLISLEELKQCIPGATEDSAQAGTMKFCRPTPPKGGLELLDQFRRKDVRMWSARTEFIGTFHRVTRGVLRGLDWTNVFVAGGVISTILFHTDRSKDEDHAIQAPDIDLYLYGLSAADATAKVKHIYDVWAQNVETPSQERLVVKNAKTITLLPTYPNRRLQIVLKLCRSPTDILLNFDLDICAVGFNGSDVMMLPRCARAIETGYSVFTMDLVWGHHLGDRRASQESRIFKYADRGYGLRILPSYAKCLEDPSRGEQVPTSVDFDPGCGWEEPGLKTLKRIETAARSSVRRICKMFADDSSDAAVPRLRFENVDNPRGGSKGLHHFENFMRHYHLWVLEKCENAVIIERDPPTGRADPASYNDSPYYRWDETFNTRDIKAAIDESNFQLYRYTKAIQLKQGLLSDVLHPTLQLRRQLYGPDLASVQDRPLVIPVVMPPDLEDFIQKTWSAVKHQQPITLPLSGRSMNIMEDVSDATSTLTQHSVLPDIHLRLWVIDSQTIWAGQCPIMDEVFELLWPLFYWARFIGRQESWFKQTSSEAMYHKDTFQGFIEIASTYRRRMVLSSLEDCTVAQPALLMRHRPTPSMHQRLSRREAILFRPWVLQLPSASVSGPFPERYQSPDADVWRDGDEGLWDGEGAPLWVHVE